ncbi:MAG: S8 family serine peptidase [Flavobacteriales bacterium]|nr:S8 family serine peptidase [Flavobacteriales bacterium]
MKNGITACNNFMLETQLRGYSRIVLTILLLSIPILTMAQLAPSRYRVTFTDKANTPFSIANPLEFLSQKSVDRRNKQGIAVKAEDLPIDPAYISATLQTGVQLLNRSKWFNCITVYTQDSTLLDSIKALPFVLGIDTLGIINPEIYQQAKLPSESKWVNEYMGPATVSSNATDYGQGFNQISMLRGDILHGIGYKGAGMTIAVMDAGFQDANANPAFYATKILGTWDFVDGNDSVYDNGKHGLWVLSIMAANIPGVFVGVAPEASYYLFRTEDSNSEFLIEEDNWVSAAEYADSAGVDILSTSLGYKTFTDPNMNHTYADMDGNTTRISIGADKAASKGMLVVNSAGNAGNTSWQFIVAPADGDSVLAVGSVDVLGNYSSFSSTGPTFDGAVKPNVVAMGQATTTITVLGGTQTGNGTSFAAPLISGMAACLWQAHPNATSMEIYDAIQQSAHQYSAPDNFLGHGIPNFMHAHQLLDGKPLTDDEDGDGVPDVEDKCLLTPFPAVVDGDGCPLSFEIEGFLSGLENPIGSSISHLYYADVDAHLELTLFDLSGKKVAETTVALVADAYNDISMTDLGSLAQGLYVLKLTSGETSGSRKLMKH